MQIKQFSADTIDEVLAQVRTELGEDAMILQTKRVVKGGIGGFFGREGVEVTAAAGARDDEAANREAAASVAIDTLAVDEEDEAPAPAPEPFRRHLDVRLVAAEEAEAPAAGPCRSRSRCPGGRLRPRRPVRAGRARAQPGHPRGRPRGRAPGPRGGPRVGGREPAAPARRRRPTRGLPRPLRPRRRPGPAARQAGPQAPLDAVRAELVRAGVEERYLDPFLDGFVPLGGPVPRRRRPRCARRSRSTWPHGSRSVRDWKARAAGHTIAIVGQTGVGKTSTAANIAGRYRAAGLAVALVAAGPGRPRHPRGARPAARHPALPRRRRPRAGRSLRHARRPRPDRDRHPRPLPPAALRNRGTRGAASPRPRLTRYTW